MVIDNEAMGIRYNDKPESGVLNYNFNCSRKSGMLFKGFMEHYGFLRFLDVQLGNDIV